jgi:hypothetical protein
MDAVVPLGVDAEDAVGPEDPEQQRRRDDEHTSASQTRRIDLKTFPRSASNSAPSTASGTTTYCTRARTASALKPANASCALRVGSVIMQTPA